MSIKKSIVLFLLILGVWSCAGGRQKGVVKISGTINNPIPQGEIVLEKYEIGQVVPVKTVSASDDGSFEIEAPVEEPGFYRINVYGQQFEMLVLDDEDITVNADGQGGSFIEAKGSVDMKYLSEVMDYLAGYSQVVRDFNQRYRNAQQAGDNLQLEELTDEGIALEALKIDRLKALAWKMDDSIVPILITDYFPNKTDEYNFLDSLGQKLFKELPESSHVKMFVENLPYFKPAVQIGDIAPDLTLPKPDGTTMSLSDLRGKYVLLDFWAAWCGPCRKENPNVVRMYQQYNAAGFEVFSVSLDRSREQWLAAIEQDGLIWSNHVSDLKYFQSEAALTYKISSIPFALLLDPDGRVIGKNLRGRRLEQKLQSIFREGE